MLFAFGDDGADSSARVEAGNACAAGAQTFRQGSLGAELDLDFAGEELALEFGVFADVAGDHLLDLARGQQQPKASAVDTGIVAGDGQIAHAGIAQGEDEFLRNAAEAETTDGEEHSVADDSFEGGFRVGEELIHRRSSGECYAERFLAPVACFT